MIDLDESHLAAYATRSSDSGGRAHPAAEDVTRSPFELDRLRIIESTAFRRLEHKTQVFTAAYHDHFRTRLTHTLEVADIARTLARAMRANEYLAEAIALAHDLGHPPFGHAGESALNDQMSREGGFNHNAHSLRVVEYLEHPFPEFRGLNLTQATRLGMTFHETQYDVPSAVPDTGPGQKSRTSGGGEAPSVEAQIVSAADRIAFGCHDLEDAIGAGLVALDQLVELGVWRRVHERKGTSYEACSVHAIRRPILETILSDLLHRTVLGWRGSIEAKPEHVQPAPASPGISSPVASPPASTSSTNFRLPPDVAEQLSELEHFLRQRVYTNPEIARMDARGREMVTALFEAYRRDPSKLPQRFAARVPDQGLNSVICDYIAGMTDRFCAQGSRLVG